jgi:hypothetical protein
LGHLANLRAAPRRTKAIDDPLLNRLGLQVARTAAAHARLRVGRTSRPADPEVAAWYDDLRREGFVQVEDFLAAGDLARAQEAATAVLEDPEVPRDRLAQGANRLEVLWRSDLGAETREALDALWCDPRLLALASAAEQLAVAPGAGRCTVQRLVQVDGEPDLEASVHVDTFHPTHKAWLYLTDVTEADGPLLYHPRSHRLDATVLGGIYRESTGANAGSRRVPAAEIERRGVAARAFTCAANTLVVADTFGYHGRVQGRPPGARTALQVEWRPDPFRRGRAMAPDRSVASGRG